MARISGVDLPNNKRIEIALTYIYGIGRISATKIVEQTKIDPDLRAKNLSDEQISQIRGVTVSDYMVEGDLRRETNLNIKRLMDLGNYRGLRHRRGLPVRGQRTKTNARSRKGPKKTVAGKKSVKGMK